VAAILFVEWTSTDTLRLWVSAIASLTKTRRSLPQIIVIPRRCRLFTQCSSTCETKSRLKWRRRDLYLSFRKALPGMLCIRWINVEENRSLSGPGIPNRQRSSSIKWWLRWICDLLWRLYVWFFGNAWMRCFAAPNLLTEAIQACYTCISQLSTTSGHIGFISLVGLHRWHALNFFLHTSPDLKTNLHACKQDEPYSLLSLGMHGSW